MAEERPCKRPAEGAAVGSVHIVPVRPSFDSSFASSLKRARSVGEGCYNVLAVGVYTGRGSEFTAGRIMAKIYLRVGKF